MQPVEWRPIPGLPYAISSDGRVARIVDYRTGAWCFRLRIIRKATNGYDTVTMFDRGPPVPKNVHRMMCEIFIGPPPSSKHQAAHKNGNKSHNFVDNLRWALPSSNQLDSVMHGKIKMGENSPSTTRKKADIEAFRREYSEIKPKHGRISRGQAKALRDRHGLPKSTAYRIINYETWRPFSTVGPKIT